MFHLLKIPLEMASALQQQLNLRRKTAEYAAVTRDKSVPAKASLLFNQEKAEHLDLETILNIGTNGLMELRKYDERFAAFEATLFSPTSLTLTRAQMTKEATQKLDKSIEQFLRLLSPYFLLKPAHKALEWLLRRYQYVLPRFVTLSGKTESPMIGDTMD